MKTQRMLTNKASLQFCVLSEKGAYFFFKKKEVSAYPPSPEKCVMSVSLEVPELKSIYPFLEMFTTTIG